MVCWQSQRQLRAAPPWSRFLPPATSTPYSIPWSSKVPSVLWSQLRSWQRIWGIVGQRFHEVSAAIEDHAEEGARMAISSNAGECQAYLQAALVVVRRFRLAHSCSCSGDGRDRLPHASPSSLTLPFNITHNLHGPSRRHFRYTRLHDVLALLVAVELP